jgi:hypothetical protein
VHEYGLIWRIGSSGVEFRDPGVDTISINHIVIERS